MSASDGNKQRGAWRPGPGFVLAVVDSAIGLANVRGVLIRFACPPAILTIPYQLLRG